MPFAVPSVFPYFRVRKMKDRYAITEIRKQANRMTFGSVCYLKTVEYISIYFTEFELWFPFLANNSHVNQSYYLRLLVHASHESLMILAETLTVIATEQTARCCLSTIKSL